MQGIASALTHMQHLYYHGWRVPAATTSHKPQGTTIDGCVQGIAKGERRALLSLPLQNALVVTDDALEGISVFGDGCLRLLQQRHGRGAQLPSALLSFVTGTERWDVRMTALLLWFMGKGGGGGGQDKSAVGGGDSSTPGASSSGGDASLWQEYRSSLPHERDMSCLLRLV